MQRSLPGEHDMNGPATKQSLSSEAIKAALILSGAIHGDQGKPRDFEQTQLVYQGNDRGCGRLTIGAQADAHRYRLAFGL